MARPCSVCIHADRPAIDRALLAGTVMRELAATFRVSEDAITRHAAAHLPASLTKARDAEAASNADSLLGQARFLQSEALGILDQAREAGDLRTALLAIRETRSTLELLARLMGELDDRPIVNILVAPQWLQVRASLLGALQGHPEAAVSVATALARLEGHGG